MDQRAMRCPRCNAPLSRRDLEEAGVHTQAHFCPQCDGQYFSSGRLEPIKDITTVDIFDKPKVPDTREQLRPLHCPRCGEANTMEKVPSPRDKKVLLDVCRKCGGTWLDKGELEAIRKEGLLSFLYDVFSWFSKN